MKNTSNFSQIKSISFIIGTKYVSLQHENSDIRSGRSNLFDFINLNQTQLRDLSRGDKFE